MDREIKLISKTYSVDDIGQEIEVETESTVFAEIEPISQSEFFNAGQSGFKPSMKCVMWSFEYENQNEILADNIRYSVYRTYVRKDEKVELYCEKRTGNG